MISNKILLIVVLILLYNVSIDSSKLNFTQTFKTKLIDQLKRKFFDVSLLNGLNETDNLIENQKQIKNNLKSFQYELIKKRNYDCPNQTINDWSLIKFKNRTDLDYLLSNFSSNDFPISNQALNFNRMCFESDLLFEFFDPKSRDEINDIFQIVLSQFNNEGCNFCIETPNDKVQITKLQTWGYGILFVTLISASSLCGAFVIPFSKKKIYKKILLFLIAIAVGSLAGSGFLHLIPQSYGITEDEKYAKNHNYVWKGLTMMGGVYLFYIVEKFMKIMIQRKKSKTKKTSTIKTAEKNNPQILESIGYLKTHEPNVEPSVEMRVHLCERALEENNIKQNSHGHSHDVENLQLVSPVAWMIIFGDGLHNFIDGLSIGAAFTESVLKGISICLAVMCEEFPHELGDFAILINAGMRYQIALLFNFLSACCCYVGLAVGITLGENFGANEWIYAIAGGMFLYISLCDMIPELNEMGEEIERDYYEDKKQKRLIELSVQSEEEKNLQGNNSRSNTLVNVEFAEPFDLKIKIKILLLQNTGILCGFWFMLFMAIYSEKINF